MFRQMGRGAFLLFLALCNSAAHAEYCLNYSSGMISLARQAGSSDSRGCVATEAQCKAAQMSKAGSYSGSCYYIPGFYPPTGTGKAGSNNKSHDQAAEGRKKNQDAQQKAADQAREQAIFDQDKQQWMGGLKGVSPPEPENRITLKPVPPTGGVARSQLDCAAHRKPDESWENHATDCTPADPRVPEPSKPTEVPLPGNSAPLAKSLEGLGKRIAISRNALMKQDNAIATQEREIAREEQRAAASQKPAGESDALKRAREALKKAKADRTRTAAELAKLEQQALTTENKAAPATP